jgi:F-type H+-transporting ATPase subunit a
VFVLFNAVGFIVNWKSYLGHMWGPVFLVGFLLFPVEVITTCFRPITLSVRLTGNIFGDHTAFTIMSQLVPVVVPALMLALAAFVAVVQAFIFTVLTSVYVALAHPPAGHDAHH